MERYKGQWCVTVAELTQDDRTPQNPADYLKPIIGEAYLRKMCFQSKVDVLRRGGGLGSPALIAYDSLPERIKTLLQMKYPDMDEQMKQGDKPLDKLFRDAYKVDYKARAFYWDWAYSSKVTLTHARIEAIVEEYTANASVIQAVVKLKTDNKLYRKVRGKRGASWADMAEAIKFFKDEVGHTLGTSPTRFARWVREFELGGYEALISKKFGNDNTKKVNVMVEQLLLAMARDQHRPTGKKVWEWYCDFKAGEVTMLAPSTGELLNPKDYPDLSEKTVGDILERAENRAVVAIAHEGRHDYQTLYRPHNKRRKPKYSLSMVSMDDKDFAIKVRFTKTSSKLQDGRRRTEDKSFETALKAYLCYDVASEAIIGYCFSVEKNTDIFLGCVRSMYRNLMMWGLGQPHEAQVENHLVSQFKDTMMKGGRLFPEVSFAKAENSQEKYAEQFNNQLKHQFEKYMVSEPVGRPHARLESNRTKNRKVSDSTNTAYKQNVYEYDDAVRLYTRIIDEWNNALHPRQKEYPNMSRLDVLLRCQHSDIQPINEAQLARWAGEQVLTSVNDRGLMRVKGEDYIVLPAQEARLAGRDNKVEAYFFDMEDGTDIDMVYLYQDDVPLGTCRRQVPYQVSKLERTTEDMQIFARQNKRLKDFDQAVKSKIPEDIVRIDSEAMRAMELKPVAKIVAPLEGDFELQAEDFLKGKKIDYASKALADL